MFHFWALRWTQTVQSSYNAIVNLCGHMFRITYFALLWFTPPPVSHLIFLCFSVLFPPNLRSLCVRFCMLLFISVLLDLNVKLCVCAADSGAGPAAWWRSVSVPSTIHVVRTSAQLVETWSQKAGTCVYRVTLWHLQLAAKAFASLQGPWALVWYKSAVSVRIGF